MKKYKQGYTGIPNFILDDETLSGKAKLVYFYLLRFNPSFPSYTVIAKKCGMNRNTVSAALSELESFGALKRVKAGRKNQYKLKTYDSTLAEIRQKTSTPIVPIEDQPVSRLSTTSTSFKHEPVQSRYSNKTNEKYVFNKGSLTEILKNLKERPGG